MNRSPPTTPTTTTSTSTAPGVSLVYPPSTTATMANNTEQQQRSTIPNLVQSLTQTTTTISLMEITTTQSLRTFVKFLITFKPKELKHIDFSRNQLTDSHIQELIPILSYSTKSLPKLQELNLSYNRISSSGIIQLSKPLNKLYNKTLGVLNLDYNFIDDKGILALVIAIQKHPTVRELSLCNNYITSTGIFYLVYLTQNNPRIQAINIVGNPVSVESVQALSEALIQNNNNNILLRQQQQQQRQQQQSPVQTNRNSTDRQSTRSNVSHTSIINHNPPTARISTHIYDQNIIDGIPTTATTSTTTTTNASSPPPPPIAAELLIVAEAAPPVSDDMSDFIQTLLNQIDELRRENEALKLQVRQLQVVSDT
jgi:hypothetical protein